jgi:uncharacterized protein
MSHPPTVQHTRHPLSAGRVSRVGIMVYVLAALLNSSDLLAQAERMPLTSPMRKYVALPIAKALHSTSKAMRFDVPGRRVDELRGIAATEKPGAAFDGSTTTTASLPTTSAVSSGSSVATTAATTVPPTTTTTLPKVPSKSTPLPLYIGGDSLVQGWGAVLQRLTVGTQMVVAPSVDYRAATGLARPDSYDWPARLVQQMGANHPQVVVVGFGGNDGQGLAIGSKSVQPGTSEWVTEYARRVGETMDYLGREHRKVIWVGTPMPQNSKDFANQAAINQIYRDEVAKRPAITFIDTWVLFESPEHSYTAYLVDDDGVAKLMRQGDGFHLSIAGAERLGRSVFNAVRAELKARGATITA